MLLDSKHEGEQLMQEIGGICGQKVRSYPKGAWEWYYHGPGLLDLCRELRPSLNFYQQKYLGDWLE